MDDNKPTNVGYSYSSDKDLFAELFAALLTHCDPFVKSYEIDKKAFALQTANLILIFVFLNYALHGLLSSITQQAGSASLGLNLLITIVLAWVLSALSANKVLKWQTLFEMNYQYTKKWLRRLIVLNVVGYWIKYFWMAVFPPPVSSTLTNPNKPI